MPTEFCWSKEVNAASGRGKLGEDQVCVWEGQGGGGAGGGGAGGGGAGEGGAGRGEAGAGGLGGLEFGLGAGWDGGCRE